MAEFSSRRTLGERLRSGLVWVCAALAIGTIVLAVRSFWRSNEVAYCSWSPKPPYKGVDSRVIIGVYKGGAFLAATERVRFGFSKYAGDPQELILRSTALPELYAAALWRGPFSRAPNEPRWLWGGFNLSFQHREFEGYPASLSMLVIPLWVPFLALAWQPLRAARRQWVLRRRRQHGECLYCGYDLRASGPICSECGQLRAELRPKPAARPRRVRSSVPAVCASVAGAVAVLVWLVRVGTQGAEPLVEIGANTIFSPGHSPKRVELRLCPVLTMQFALIPAGRFTMGSPEQEDRRDDDENLHEVSISKAFYMGVTSVTQEQYQAIIGNNPSDDSYLRPNMPVNSVSWLDAVAFCQKVSRRTGRRVHLPSEAQWEYACRAGTTTPFNTGRKLTRDMANWAVGHYFPSNRTCPDEDCALLLVASFRPNAWGLHDMHGGVRQWCLDWYGPYPEGPLRDPVGPDQGTERVQRGGYWLDCVDYCRSAARHRREPDMQFSFESGFRVAMDLDAPPALAPAVQSPEPSQ